MSRTGDNIYFRGSTGKWEGRYVKGRRPNGRLKYGYVSGRSYDECRQKRSMAEKALDESKRQAVMGDRLLFCAAAEDWLRTRSKLLKDSTVCKYRNNLKNHLCPKFAGRSFTDITREEVTDYISELLADKSAGGRGMSANTVKGIISVLCAVVEYGSARHHIPAANLSRLSIGEPEDPPLRVLSVSEEEALLDHILSDLDNEGMGILLCLYTGLRLGELCALRWENISFKDNRLSVRSTMKRIQTDDPFCRTKVVTTTPKSRRSVRDIPLHEDLIETLKRRAGEKEAYFLTGRKNVYIDPRTMQNRFKAITKAVGISGASFHALRHTFATRSIEAGVDPKALSMILGHASVKLTLDRYVHPSESERRKSVNKLRGFREGRAID